MTRFWSTIVQNAIIFTVIENEKTHTQYFNCNGYQSSMKTLYCAKNGTVVFKQNDNSYKVQPKDDCNMLYFMLRELSNPKTCTGTVFVSCWWSSGMAVHTFAGYHYSSKTKTTFYNTGLYICCYHSSLARGASCRNC